MPIPIDGISSAASACPIVTKPTCLLLSHRRSLALRDAHGALMPATRPEPGPSGFLMISGLRNWMHCSQPSSSDMTGSSCSNESTKS